MPPVRHVAELSTGSPPLVEMPQLNSIQNINHVKNNGKMAINGNLKPRNGTTISLNEIPMEPVKIEVLKSPTLAVLEDLESNQLQTQRIASVPNIKPQVLAEIQHQPPLEYTPDIKPLIVNEARNTTVNGVGKPTVIGAGNKTANGTGKLRLRGKPMKVSVTSVASHLQASLSTQNLIDMDSAKSGKLLPKPIPKSSLKPRDRSPLLHSASFSRKQGNLGTMAGRRISVALRAGDEIRLEKKSIQIVEVSGKISSLI